MKHNRFSIFLFFRIAIYILVNYAIGKIVLKYMYTNSLFYDECCETNI